MEVMKLYEAMIQYLETIPFLYSYRYLVSVWCVYCSARTRRRSDLFDCPPVDLRNGRDSAGAWDAK